jgi:hypothetical protein
VPIITLRLLRSHRARLIGSRVRGHPSYESIQLNSASA